MGRGDAKHTRGTKCSRHNCNQNGGALSPRGHDTAGHGFCQDSRCRSLHSRKVRDPVQLLDSRRPIGGGHRARHVFSTLVVKDDRVAVETVTPVTRVLALSGRIAASHSVDLRPLVNGTLSAVLVAEGDMVMADEELARIDATAQQASVRQAVAGLDTALVALEETQMTYNRLQALGDFAARTTLENAARAVQSAEQEVPRTTALVDQARIQLDHFTIRAPMAGSVLELKIDPGQRIDTSTVLMTIADVSRLEVEPDVDEVDATQIHIGQPVVLQLAGETTSRTGRVSFVSQRVDAAT